jgi:hypothetical protein
MDAYGWLKMQTAAWTDTIHTPKAPTRRVREHIKRSDRYSAVEQRIVYLARLDLNFEVTA